MGLCPFHQEKTASFSVSSDKQLYYCFGCQKSGNVFSFLMDYSRLGYVEAIEQLAGQLGMVVEYDQNHSEVPQKSLEPLYQVLAEADRYYRSQLRCDDAGARNAIKYLKSRGLEGRTVAEYGIGFAPHSRDGLLKTLGQGNEESIKLLLEAGLIKENPRAGPAFIDRLQERITFPIRNTRGKVVGFGGRSINSRMQPKYLNSPETPIFHKKRLLYGIYEALRRRFKEKSLILTEGYIDTVMLAQYGFGNAVASLGTAISQEHLELALRYVDGLIFCFDGDSAGYQAAIKVLPTALSAMRDGRKIEFVFLSDDPKSSAKTGRDPADILQNDGTEAFQTLLQKNTVKLSDFFFNHLSDDLELDSCEDQARLYKLVLPFLNNMQPSQYRQLLVDRLAKQTGIDTTRLNSALLSEPPQEKYKARSVDTENQGHRGSSHHSQPDRRQLKTVAVVSLLRQLLILLVQQPQLVDRIPADCPFDREDPCYPLLTELLQLLHSQQIATSAGIFAHFDNNHPHYADIVRLMEDTVVTNEQDRQQQIDAIIKKIIDRHSRPQQTLAEKIAAIKHKQQAEFQIDG